ncbi:hypothetical protein GCM10007385_40880 [Tateyamaria omphalii]|uniref:protein O-mannosyl-transferase family n=1 Tax=Tateyamaria omphalii TaxID=299262 RepID=UPI00167356D1|nr:DUF2723 domain-containing protein [Tateyamaria omphalii]GGX67557.1 hypothetical protein GCM10007385_40880 [Tateyamaria omphalii]
MPKPTRAYQPAYQNPWLAITVFLVWLSYYACLLFPGLGGMLNAGDSAKFQTLGHTSILVHGPGYPFVLMIGTVVRAIDLPFEPWRVMTIALASLPGAFAVVMAFLIVGRLTRNVLFGLAAAFLLGSAGLMAVQSTEAEVYPLALAFILSVVFALILFVETKRAHYFVLACAIYALSFGNHLMMIMLAPVGLLVMATHHRILLRPRILLAVLGLLAVGASQYLYLAWVTHRSTTAYSEYLPLPPTKSELIDYIAGTYFGDLYGSGLKSMQTASVLLGTLSQAHPLVSLPIMGLGLVAFALGWRHRNAAWLGVALLLGTAFAFLPFMIWYGAYDIQAFHLPVLGPLLIGAIAAIGWWMTRWPRLGTGLGMLLIGIGVFRASEMAIYLSAREPDYADLVDTLDVVMAQSPVDHPVVSMSYELRMATLYHELRGEVPQPATYRVTWRTEEAISDLGPVGGIVIPTDGEQMLRWIEHKNPHLSCRMLPISQTEPVTWPAYGFFCDPSQTSQELPKD